MQPRLVHAGHSGSNEPGRRAQFDGDEDGVGRHGSRLPGLVADACHSELLAQAASAPIASGTRLLSACPACGRRALRAPGWRSFFKSRLLLGIFLRMHRTRLQSRQAEFAKPGPNRALMHLDRPAAGDFGPQVRAPPAHDLMHRRIRALDHQCYLNQTDRVLPKPDISCASDTRSSRN